MDAFWNYYYSQNALLWFALKGGSAGKISLAKGGRSFGALFPIIQLVRNVGQQPPCSDRSDPGKREPFSCSLVVYNKKTVMIKKKKKVVDNRHAGRPTRGRLGTSRKNKMTKPLTLLFPLRANNQGNTFYANGQSQRVSLLKWALFFFKWTIK